jgi:hypothetical protein
MTSRQIEAVTSAFDSEWKSRPLATGGVMGLNSGCRKTDIAAHCVQFDGTFSDLFHFPLV